MHLKFHEPSRIHSTKEEEEEEEEEDEEYGEEESTKVKL
jgi:hypothetical protein